MIFHRVLLAVSLSCSSFASLPPMTLEEKVGQLFMVHFVGETVNEDAKTLIQKIHVGGFVYYTWTNGLHSPEQISSLSSALQKISAIPLLIAADQEGGLVSRFTKGFTVFPGNKALGMTQNPDLAEQSAFAMGQELSAVGVNLNLAPVVDVNRTPRNPIIGIRSFGDSTDTVIPFARSAIEGYHRAGILTSIKHYPGHGDVDLDSHHDLPVVDKTRQQIEAVELLPFSALAHQTDAVMTAHILIPAIDSNNCATLSKSILDILRNEMGFDGVIVSDSLVMAGLLKNCASIDDAAIRAFNAGCDILLFGGKQLLGSSVNRDLPVADVERIHRSFVNAVKNGLVSEKRLDDSVQRILKMKHKIAAGRQGGINTPEHQKLAQKIATQALRITGNNIDPRHLRGKIAIIAPNVVEEETLCHIVTSNEAM